MITVMNVMRKMPVSQISQGFLVKVDGKVWEVISVADWSFAPFCPKWNVRVKDSSDFHKTFVFIADDSVLASLR
jgi:hypothetical protein